MKLQALQSLSEDRFKDAIKADDVLEELEVDLSTMHAVAKQMSANGVRPTSNYLKRVWLAHEKLGEIYALVEKAKRG